MGWCRRSRTHSNRHGVAASARRSPNKCRRTCRRCSASPRLSRSRIRGSAGEKSEWGQPYNSDPTSRTAPTTIPKAVRVRLVGDPHAASAGHGRACRNCQMSRRAATSRRTDARINSDGRYGATTGDRLPSQAEPNPADARVAGRAQHAAAPKAAKIPPPVASPFHHLPMRRIRSPLQDSSRSRIYSL